MTKSPASCRELITHQYTGALVKPTFLAVETDDGVVILDDTNEEKAPQKKFIFLPICLNYVLGVEL